MVEKNYIKYKTMTLFAYSYFKLEFEPRPYLTSKNFISYKYMLEYKYIVNTYIIYAIYFISR